MLSLPHGTKEYVRTTLKSSADPTGTLPDFAFMVGDRKPTVADWKAGSWVAGTTYDARLLIGPGSDVDLEPGRYTVWFRVIDNPEIPIDPFDTLELY